MADRPNQFNGYPTIPNNFGNGMTSFQQQLQMQQLVQQQQQNALNQNRGIPGAGNNENQQMWQQLQHQQRSQMGGMDMGNQGLGQVCSQPLLPLHNLFRLSVAFTVRWWSLGTPDPWRSYNPILPYAVIAAMTSFFSRPLIALSSFALCGFLFILVVLVETVRVAF